MKKILLLLVSISVGMLLAHAQDATPKNDTASLSAKEARRFKKLLALAKYPLIKGDPMTGVLPVDEIDAKPDSLQPYKLLFVWTYGTKDTVKAKKINFALTEIGRIVNLHLASGIPLRNMDMVVAVHGLSVFGLENDDAYQKRFHVNNPNRALIKELQDAGVKFIACGQAMGFLEIEKASLLPGVKKALTAQTILSSYQMKGFALFDVNSED
ncbi:MAG: hypothetical protein RLZZ28_1435 [Bacteroidota bacterium]